MLGMRYQQCCRSIVSYLAKAIETFVRELAISNRENFIKD